jgi:hypothetical protein
MLVATASIAGSHGCQARQAAPGQHWPIREEEELCLEEVGLVRRGVVGSRRVRSVTPPARECTVQLAILTLAIVVAVPGFADHFLSIGTLVLMGVLWGVMVAERQQRPGTVKGLAAEW